MDQFSFTIDILQHQNHNEATDFCYLFENVYENPIDVKTWHWKYHGALFGKSFQLVARLTGSGEMVGHIGAVILPGRLSSNDNHRIHWAQIGDIMVHKCARSDLRAGGLYQQLVLRMQQELHKFKQNDLMFAYGFPGLRPFTLGQRLGYYREIYRCQEFEYSHEPEVAWWRRHYWRPLRIRQVLANESLESANKIEKELNTVPRLIKDSQYLEWRYRNHPNRRYKIWWIHKYGNPPSGWLVTSETEDALSVIIVDSLIPQNDHQAAIQALITRYPNHRITGWLNMEHCTSLSTPIVATEFGTPDFHKLLPQPSFQPGDTDVF